MVNGVNGKIQNDDKKALGSMGESLAISFLKKQKYAVLEKNYRCRCGEIDVIAKDGRTIVFVEVKTRRNSAYGPPQLSVTRSKQWQISKAALTYLQYKKLVETSARFDVIAINLADPAQPQIDHIKNAFDLAY